MDDKQVMHAMSLDDMYHVEKVLARGSGGVTELVTVDGVGPFVRKKMASALANRGVWSALSACNCVRLPRVEATYELPEQYVAIYDYVPGETLDSLVSRSGRLDRQRAMELASGVCEAAAALHAMGVVHRDISPKNVIVAADGAHLIDLGIARLRVEGATRDTTSLGTWGYASPEQYGFAQTDARSDVYSIGRVLGFMLTGLQPDSDGYQERFEDDNIVSVADREVISRACAFEPSKRYQSVEELAEALRAASDGCRPEPVPSSGVRLPDVSDAPAAPAALSRGHRHGHVAIVAVAIVAGAALAVLAGVWLARPMTSQVPSSAQADSLAFSAPAATSRVAAAAPNASGNAYDGTPISEKGDLQLLETGWSMDDSGYLVAVFCLKNASADTSMTTPMVRVTARTADGSVLCTQDQGAMVLLPGEESYGYILGDTGGKVPETVDFELLDLDQTHLSTTNASCSMTVENVAATSDQYGGTTFTGDVAVDIASFREAYPDMVDKLAVTVVLRNQSGAPIYAMEDYVAPSASGSTPFSISVYGAPDYASYDVHVQSW